KGQDGHQLFALLLHAMGKEGTQGWVKLKEPLIETICDFFRHWRGKGKSALYDFDLLRLHHGLLKFVYAGASGHYWVTLSVSKIASPSGCGCLTNRGRCITL